MRNVDLVAPCRPRENQLIEIYGKPDEIQPFLHELFLRQSTARDDMTTNVVAPLIDARNGSSMFSVNGGPPVDICSTMIRNLDPGSTTGVPSLTLPAGLSKMGLPVGLSLDWPMGSDSLDHVVFDLA